MIQRPLDGVSSRRLYFAACLVLASLNLRPAFSSISAVLPALINATGLTASQASALSALPVVCLGIFAPAAPVLTQRFGSERTLLGVLLLLTFGLTLRAFGSPPHLYASAILCGMAIAVGNAILPAVIKSRFQDHVATMTGLYTMGICAGAAAAAGLTAPLQHAFNGDWTRALAVWAIPVGLVALLVVPLAARPEAQTANGNSTVNVWRVPIAWQLTLFMGFQSALAYCIFAWLPAILQARGLDSAAAGGVAALSYVGQLTGCLLAPSIAVRQKNQSWLGAGLIATSSVLLIGCLRAPLEAVWPLAFVQGLLQGATLAVAMTMIAMRSADAAIAAKLSGMVHCIGYCIAAAGPALVGILFDLTHSYDATVVLIVVLGLCGAIAGFGAGRNRVIGAG